MLFSLGRLLEGMVGSTEVEVLINSTAQSIRTAKKPAQNIATYRILLQLGEVDDADELARSVIGSSSGSPSSSSSDVDTSESSAAEESGSGMDA